MGCSWLGPGWCAGWGVSFPLMQPLLDWFVAGRFSCGAEPSTCVKVNAEGMNCLFVTTSGPLKLLWIRLIPGAL